MKKLSNEKGIILSAMASVLISALVFSYATYSWFTMNRTVKATGMNLVATVPTNLQISLTGSNNDAEWFESVTVSVEDVLTNTIPGYDDTKDFALLPASSYAGFNGTIYQTSRAAPNGQALVGTNFNLGHEVEINSENYYEAHYIDIPLYFRTSYDKTQELYLKKEAIATEGTYITSAGSNLYKITRLAFIAPGGTTNSMGGATPLVYADPDHGMGANKVVTSTTDYTTQAPDYIQFTNGADGIVSDDAVLTLQGAEYSGSTVTTYHVSSLIVRMWIEGQDNYCVENVGGDTYRAGLEFIAQNS